MKKLTKGVSLTVLLYVTYQVGYLMGLIKGDDT